MWKRPALATVVTAGGLVLLLSFKTPSGGPAGVDGGNANGGTGGSGGQGVQQGTTRATYSGTLTGNTVRTPFGDVQVQVTLQNGTITDVQAMQLPSDRGRTQEISNYAGPQLRSAVLQAQSAAIDTISGATYTSEAYIRSLQSALDQLPA
jgi:uncharacterized protein with FMN-binding domain